MRTDPLAGVRGAVESLLGSANASRFSDDDLRVLKEAGYDTLEDLKVASHTGLANAKLKPARADQIIHAQARPGSGSTAAGESNRSEPRVNERATAMMKQLYAMRKQLPAPGQVLDFTEATPDLLLDPEFRSRIYIRKCYPDLFKLLVVPSRKKFIITGTPGIGKSCFLYYLLAQLLALEKPPSYILWEHWSAKNKRWCYTHATQEVYCGNQESFDTKLQDANAWYIVDGMPPADRTVPARTLCITSPCHETYQAMHKSGAKALYMPRWELEELLACRTQVYDSSVPTDLAEKLFTFYGGVARYVLGLPALEAGTVAAADVEYHLRYLKKALHRSSVAQVRAGVDSLESGPEVSNRVLHIITKDGGFELSHLEFASAWVADEFVLKALQEDCDGLASLVDHTEGAFRGHLFEALMHHLLPQGGEFTVMPIDATSLDRGDEEPLNLPSCESKMIFKNAADIWADDFKEQVYYRPVQSNFPTVDSLLRVGDTVHLFQMTVSSRRQIVSVQALTELYERLGLVGQQLDVRLYYVVPDTSLKDFTVRPAPAQSWPPQPHADQLQGTCFYVLKGGMKSRQPQQVQPLQQQQQQQQALQL